MRPPPGESRLSADSSRSARHQRMRIRTVAVSFAAAASSARRDMLTTNEERDALIESWRAWTLEALRGYADDIRQLRARAGPEEVEALRQLDDELIKAYDLVRDA